MILDKKFLSALIINSFMVASGAQHAYATDYNAEHIEKLIPQCVDRDGEIVNYFWTEDTDQLAKAGMAEFSDGTVGPYTRFSPSIIGNYSGLSILFIAAHECAHHTLGHVKSNFTLFVSGKHLSSKQQQVQETQADCEAVKELSDVYLRTEIRLAMEEFSNEVIDNNIYPSMDNRINKAMSCYR